MPQMEHTLFSVCVLEYTIYIHARFARMDFGWTVVVLLFLLCQCPLTECE